MKPLTPWNCLVHLLGLASTGCGMVYVHHGYYEGWGLPGWAYSLDAGTCAFIHQSRPEAAFQLRLSNDRGRVSLLASVDLPEGERFRYDGDAAWITSEDSQRQAMPLRGLLRLPRSGEDPTQTAHEYPLASGQRVEGVSLPLAKAIAFRTVDASIELSGHIDLAEGRDFTLELPRIAYGNEVLLAFQARFQWSDGSLHLLRHLQ